MTDLSADVVICGAGIAGVSTAFHLSAGLGAGDVVLCDPRPPLTLTSDKSTECYRNWWPNAPMVELINRSVELLDEWAGESGNVFNLNRSGYLYVTADPDTAAGMETGAEDVSALGAGELRVHRGRADDPPYVPDLPPASPEGADLFLDRALIQERFPYLTDKAAAALHVRRAGWFSAQQLGAHLLDRARQSGLIHLPRRITGVRPLAEGRHLVVLDDGRTIATKAFVNAAGPMLGEVGRMVGEDLPVFSELHTKVAYREHLGVVPRDAPMFIWSDPQLIEWSPEERQLLAAEGDPGPLLGELPANCHGRPEGAEGSPYVLALWEYERKVVEPAWPIPIDDRYPEVVMRGLTTMIPGLSAYRERMPQSTVDGGYYTKTVENRPLIGPMRNPGTFVVGALSGFGVMAAPAAGELAALHVTGRPLPAYAAAFDLRRYDDPGYLAGMEGSGGGQL